jgi:hypothetical protein
MGMGHRIGYIKEGQFVVMFNDLALTEIVG